ncbi:hypothetical protein Btru_000893 [Bulinus truncatus]|nr:hypothetical protein Btru_000893 [Bulinus truncatus]
MKYNVTPDNFGPGSNFNDATNINIVISFGPVSDEYFTNFSLLISNGIVPDLTYNFSIVHIKGTSDDSINFPLLLSLSISLGGTFVLCLILIVVWFYRRRRRTQEDSEEIQERDVHQNLSSQFYRIIQIDKAQNIDQNTYCTISPSALEDAGRKTGHTIDQGASDGGGAYSGHNTNHKIDHSTDNNTGHISDHNVDVRLTDHRNLYRQNSDHSTLDDDFTVTNRPHKKLIRNNRPSNFSSVLTDDKDQQVISAHLPKIHSVVAIQTPPLPAKMGKRRQIYEEESIYDIPSVRVDGCGQHVQKDAVTGCVQDSQMSTTNGEQSVEVQVNDEAILVSDLQPTQLHNIRLANNDNHMTSDNQPDDLKCLKSRKTSGYVNVVI